MLVMNSLFILIILMDNKSKGSSKSRKELGGKLFHSLDELSLKGVSLFKLDVNYDHLKQFLEGV
jgi:hypothetical protein